jgi:hypothetical protein
MKTKQDTFDTKMESINDACESAAADKLDAILKFMDAQLALVEVCEKERERPETVTSAELDTANAACDDALDDLIAAEFAYRAADKASAKFHAALDQARSGGAVKRLQ